ncbi:uncharacterized protein MKK02DRAFT_20877 [Dioszegia hungarica]|uniref:Signal recognition particle subunit SRP68 n=1 Tax=Dioszegia hungarica TaxID=4972 RepID=A0AA38LS26_9TREE|nr:uncharacterized protein MKK02DRAFT_20877 [Dioszegia hungarica]KAI9632084.1 hypothetical protein MKK02DRAFT_20877 [Dioszegia hungarica]
MSDQPQDLSFKVLSLLSKERGVYGLRNGDHERYRKHCGNKLQRLRHGTGLTSGKKGYKKPAEVTLATVKDVKHLQLLLFSAERALAHSHELKSALTRPNPPVGVSKKDQLSWLRRAHKYSSSLHSISSALASSSRMTQQTLAEITIYHLSLSSELSFERSNWADAITSLAVRRRLLSTFAEAARDSYDQALALEFMDAYDPLIRFAAYKLGRAESHDIPAVVADIDGEMQEEALPGVEKLVEGLRAELGSQEVEEGRRKLEDVKFAGEAIEMRSAEMVGVMTKVQAAMEAMEGKGRGMRGWDKVLGVLGEAEAVARRLVDDHEASGASNPLRSAETSRSLAQTHQYIIHLLLTHRIRRDLLLAETLRSTSKTLPSDITRFKVPGGRAKLEEAVKTLAGLIKLYDQVLQSLGQVKGLGLVQEREEVRVGVEGLESYYQATSRNLLLARLHTIHPTPSYSSAIRLLARSSSLTQQARSSLFETGPIAEPITSATETDLSALESDISALEKAAKRALFAERVDKPVFFDNAFNYVEMPMEELVYRAGKGPKPAAPSEGTGGVAAVAEVVGQVAGKKAQELEKEQIAGQGKKGWLGGWFGRG